HLVLRSAGPGGASIPPSSHAVSASQRRAVLGLTAMSLLGLSALATVGITSATEPPAPAATANLDVSAKPPPESTAEPLLLNADETLKRGERVSVSRGILYIPPAFKSPDGQFDLLMFFHGNTKLVEESVDVSKLNAVLYTMNLGIG